jgi:hypothetical protein
MTDDKCGESIAPGRVQGRLALRREKRPRDLLSRGNRGRVVSVLTSSRFVFRGADSANRLNLDLSSVICHLSFRPAGAGAVIATRVSGISVEAPASAWDTLRAKMSITLG